MEIVLTEPIVREYLANARKDINYAKNVAPNFGDALLRSLVNVSLVAEGIPISSMDFDTFWNLNLDFTRLKKNLSDKGLEKEAGLVEKISEDMVHKYTASHPLF